MHTLLVPGYRGSGSGHWQSWLETQLAHTARIDGIDWNKPVLANWAARLRDELAGASQPLRVIAHSFGCLAAVVAAADRPDLVTDLILVAPPDPALFDFTGLKAEADPGSKYSLADALPRRPLHVRGMIIASRNDLWMNYDLALVFANCWALELHDAGHAGHINTESGHGAWPDLLVLLEQRSALPVAEPEARPASGLKKGRGSTLAAVRQLTRQQLEKPHSRKNPGSGPLTNAR